MKTDSPLNDRQLEILLRLTQGQRRSFISTKMKICTAAISKAITDARTAAEVRTTEQLVAKAVRRGWIR